MTEKETNYANISTYKNNKMNNKSARVIAFYLPQFHPILGKRIHRMDECWKGKTIV